MVGGFKKKSVKKKKVLGKKTSHVRKSSPKGNYHIHPGADKVLVDNFVDLQKVMVDLATKFDNLSGEMSKILGLFELSAKHLAKVDFESNKDNKDSERILEKLDVLSEQAGLIGKGLALIHEVNYGGERGMHKPERDYGNARPMSFEEKSMSRGYEPLQEPKSLEEFPVSSPSEGSVDKSSELTPGPDNFSVVPEPAPAQNNSLQNSSVNSPVVQNSPSENSASTSSSLVKEVP